MCTLTMIFYGLTGVEWRVIDYIAIAYIDLVYIVGILAIKAVVRREKENERRKQNSDKND